MDVFVHRPLDGLYLKNLDAWVSAKADARRFDDCTAAINFCIEHELQAVRLYVAFSDPKHDFEMDVFRAETRMLRNSNRELRQQQRELLAKLDSITAEAKERKKLFP